MSSSFVPKSTESTTPTAAAASATPSADQNESIDSSELIRPARSSIPASTNSTRKKPSSAVNGSRSAATSGGSTALSTAMMTATDERGPERRVRSAGNELRGDEQRDGAEQPREHELPGPEARLLGRPARRLAVGRAHGVVWPASAELGGLLARGASPSPPPGGASPRRTSRRRAACRRPSPRPRPSGSARRGCTTPSTRAAAPPSRPSRRSARRRAGARRRSRPASRPRRRA